MKNMLYVNLLFVILFICTVTTVSSQNVAITDDDSYIANSSAMLDVKSISKGLLAPRVTTVQRNSIMTPATGLLVFDTNLNSFMYWNGTAWTNLTSGNASNLWAHNSPFIYLNNSQDRVGIGTSTPAGKMEVKSDLSLGVNDPIFQVINNNGDTVFAVYQQGVRINVEDAVGKANTSKGGFAVGGFSPAKGAYTNEYLRVTPDSVRIYIEDGPTAKANTSKGGFAVGGFSPAKLGLTNDYLNISSERTRVYVNDSTQGFGIASIQGGSEKGYVNLTTQNYFIGHESGNNIISAKYNSVLGYNAGKDLIDGDYNTLMGYNAGKSMIDGMYNIFLGNNAGLNSTHPVSDICIGYNAGASTTTGSQNIFMGYQAGMKNSTGSENIFLGDYAGWGQTNGQYNIGIGTWSGFDVADGSDNNITLGYSSGAYLNGDANVLLGTQTGTSLNGNNNVMLGAYVGWNVTGSSNVLIGYNAAGNETAISNKLFIENTDNSNPLIYGEFDNDILRFNAKVGVNSYPNTSLSVYNSNESAVLTNFTQAINNSGINIVTDYTSGAYSPGIFWSTQNENASKPKAGIWLLEDSQGTDMYFGTSNLYVTGITNNGIVISESGNAGFGTISPSYKVHAINSVASNDEPAVYGEHAVTDNWGVGVEGYGKFKGVYGHTSQASGNGYGVHGYASGTGTGTRYGVYGYATGGTTAWAGYFSGNVNVTGTLSKGGGSFKIDHPLDPENKFLYHSFVESPDMMNIYNGNAILDNDGRAEIELPSYFDALNKDFRYQLTTIGGYSQVYIEQEVQNNKFIIAGGTPGLKVSWQVTGVRQDPFANQNRIPTEVDKSTEEKGLYLYPGTYGKTIDKSIDYKLNSK